VWPTQPPIQWVPASLSPGIKRPKREADQSPSPSAEVKNAWSCTSTSHKLSWRVVYLRTATTLLLSFTANHVTIGLYYIGHDHFIRALKFSRRFYPPPLVLPLLHICPRSFPTHFALKMEAALSSDTLVSYHVTIRFYNLEDSDMNLSFYLDNRLFIITLISFLLAN